MPSFQSILVIYVVLVLFGLYILYMYEPLSAHFLFSRLVALLRGSRAGNSGRACDVVEVKRSEVAGRPATRSKPDRDVSVQKPGPPTAGLLCICEPGVSVRSCRGLLAAAFSLPQTAECTIGQTPQVELPV